MKKRFIVLFTVLLLLCGWIWYGNSAVTVSEYEVMADIPAEFDGFTIVQISDLHNTQLGENNKNVFDKLKTIDADIIVMTGDMIDGRNTKVDIALDFAKKVTGIAPCYYVTGNHEANINYYTDEYERFRAGLIDNGVIVLENESCQIERNGNLLTIIGINDTGFDMNTKIEYLLEEAIPEDDNYKILLAHRPEYFDLYGGVELIFSGHSHGGQIRLPFVGGLYAPGQGVLPEYDGGIYEKDGRSMVVSRGLGNSLFPIRVNNKPEIVVVILKA